MLVEQKKINDYRGTSMDIGQAHDLYANQKKKSLFMLNKTSPKEITPSWLGYAKDREKKGN